MHSPTLLTFPETFDKLPEFLSTPQAHLLAVGVASGKPHCGMYVLDEETGTYRLEHEASLIRALPPSFPAEIRFKPNDKNQIPVRDAAGKVKKIIAVNFADLRKGYGGGEQWSLRFISSYLIPSYAEEHAKLELARWMAEQMAPVLLGDGPVVHSPSGTNDLLGKMVGLFEPTQTVGHPLPDDNYRHGMGVSNLITGFCAALNEVAKDKRQTLPFDETLLSIVERVGRLHDIGKIQIPIRLNAYWLRNYVAPGDEDSAELHGRKNDVFQKSNYNHPLLSVIALCMCPKLAVAFGLHHQSLFRDYNKEEMGKWSHLNLVRQNLQFAEQVSFFNRMCRVADVADAIVNNGRKPPLKMLEELNNKTKERNFLGIPNIDPDILCFMIYQGVFDRYVDTKVVSRQTLEEQDVRTKESPAYLKERGEYEKLKETILREHGYNNWWGRLTFKKYRINRRFLAKIRSEPFVADYHQSVSGAGPTRGSWQRPPFAHISFFCN
jgi:hypothetical protein